MGQQTAQDHAIYIYALLAGIIGFYRTDSIGIGLVFAVFCAAVIFAAQNNHFNQSWYWLEPRLKTLYLWLVNYFQRTEQAESKTDPYVLCPGRS